MDLGFCFVKFVWRFGNSGPYVYQFGFIGNYYDVMQCNWNDI